MKLSVFFTACYALLVLYYTDRKHAEALAFLKSPGSKDLERQFPSYAKCVKRATSGTADAYDEALQEMGLSMKDSIAAMTRAGNITARYLNQLKTFAMWMRTGSEVAMKKLAVASATHTEPWIREHFAKEVGTQKSTVKSLERLIQKYFKRKGTTMTKEEGEELKAKDLDAYKQYLALRREMTGTWKDAVSTYVRQSGKDTVPIAEVLRFLKDQGLQHTWPSGFTGNVGADGMWYTKTGKRLTGIPQSVMFPQVEMMDETGDSGAVFVGVKADGTRSGYVYTEEYKKVANEEKFAAVRELTGKIDGMRRKWGQKILRFDANDQECIAALVLEMSYQHSSRIGSPTNKNGTFGMSSIQMGHVKQLANGGYRIAYLGKDGANTGVKIVHGLLPPNQGTPIDKAVTKAFIQLLSEEKDRRDFVFSVQLRNGKFAVVQPGFIRQQWYLYGAPKGAGIHKLRTLRASVRMKAKLEELYAKKKSFKTVKEFNTAIEKLAVEVGKILQHTKRTKDGAVTNTGATALKNYIDPDLVLEAHNHYGVPIPLWLEKVLNKALASVDEDDF